MVALDRNAQHKDVGDHLMRTVFAVAIELSEKLGCVGGDDAKPGAENYLFSLRLHQRAG